ncbi:hypothetical protein WA026_000745 [Henosepilachna vigintioctopunctata]|uniref:Uncharacterized protein n=1 Tax=Henosepilachna vigintioctopunctata TaxID=420089 RepID=A0AAW1V9A4_9CUCU
MFNPVDFVIGVVILTAFSAHTAYALPDYIKVCKSNEKDLAQCIINSVNSMRPQLKKGIPELDVPSLEPLFLDEIKIRSGPSAVKLDANITNIKVWGSSEFKILELRPNVAKRRFAFRALIPHIHFEGDYDVDMHILVLKYKGVGPINGNFTDYTFTCNLKGHLIKIDGKDYLRFDKMNLKLNIGKSSIRLDNLFKKDPVIAKAVNEVINENSEIFLREIQPSLEKALSEKLTNIANKLTLKFTYQELFP